MDSATVALVVPVRVGGGFDLAQKSAKHSAMTSSAGASASILRSLPVTNPLGRRDLLRNARALQRELARERLQLGHAGRAAISKAMLWSPEVMRMVDVAAPFEGSTDEVVAASQHALVVARAAKDAAQRRLAERKTVLQDKQKALYHVETAARTERQMYEARLDAAAARKPQAARSKAVSPAAGAAGAAQPTELVALQSSVVQLESALEGMREGCAQRLRRLQNQRVELLRSMAASLQDKLVRAVRVGKVGMTLRREQMEREVRRELQATRATADRYVVKLRVEKVSSGGCARNGRADVLTRVLGQDGQLAAMREQFKASIEPLATVLKCLEDEYRFTTQRVEAREAALEHAQQWTQRQREQLAARRAEAARLESELAECEKRRSALDMTRARVLVAESGVQQAEWQLAQLANELAETEAERDNLAARFEEAVAVLNEAALARTDASIAAVQALLPQVAEAAPPAEATGAEDAAAAEERPANA
jgi:hypothetical protein